MINTANREPYLSQEKPTLLPDQGKVSETTVFTDKKTKHLIVHKVMDSEKSKRYGKDLTLTQRAAAIQRIYEVLEEVFPDHVAKTQVLIATSSGVPKIEMFQKYILGESADEYPLGYIGFLQWIDNHDKGMYELTNTIMEKAQVNVDVANRVSGEIRKPSSWKWNKEHGLVLVDF